MWRKQVAKDWEEKYGVTVHGFETFVIENENRKGTLYKADNWTCIGETAGTARTRYHGIEGREEVEKKLVFAKMIKGTHLATEYTATWNVKGFKREVLGQQSLF